MGGHVAVMPTENGHALTLELGSPDLNENLCPSVPVSSFGSVSGEAALSFREALPTCPCALCLPLKPEPGPPGLERPNTHVVLYQLVDGQLSLQQVVVESDNLVAQSSLLFVIVFALGQGGGRGRRRSALRHITVTCSLRPLVSPLAAHMIRCWGAPERRGKSTDRPRFKFSPLTSQMAPGKSASLSLGFSSGPEASEARPPGIWGED